jgi:SAM-dependent methyltransferase
MPLKQLLLTPVKLFYSKIFNPRYKKSLAQHIATLCPDGATILDYGCDDGSTARLIMQYNPTLKIVGVDIQAHRAPQIPIKIFNGRIIPYPDNSFDAVIALDVLHHTTDIAAQLKELRRVSKKQIIIKDHLITSPVAQLLVSGADWLSNVIHDIPCAFNYPTREGWRRLFAGQDLGVRTHLANLDLGFGKIIGGEQNPIFVLEKK